LGKLCKEITTNPALFIAINVMPHAEKEKNSKILGVYTYLIYFCGIKIKHYEKCIIKN
jgi:hypothetical protein